MATIPDCFPNDVLGLIYGHLDTINLMLLSLVSKSFYERTWSIDLRGRRIIEEIARADSIELYEKMRHELPMTDHTMYVAAEGSINMLQRLDGYFHNVRIENVYESAIRAECIPTLSFINSKDISNFINEYLVDLIINSHNLEMIKWMIERGCHRVNLWFRVLLAKNVEVINLVHTYRPIYRYDWSGYYIDRLDILEWFLIHAPGYNFRDLFRKFNPPIMDLLHELGYRAKPKHIQISSAEILKWYISHDYEIDNVYANIAKNSGDNWEKIFEYAVSLGLKLSESDFNAVMGREEIVDWILDREICPRTEYVAKCAAYRDHKLFVKLIEYGCPIPDIMVHMVKEGKLDTIKWLIDNGISVTPRLYADANDHEVLELLVNSGCPRTADVYVGVLRRRQFKTIDGKLHRIQYLRRNRFPWDSRVCFEASILRDHEIIDWIHANGCICSSTCKYRK